MPYCRFEDPHEIERLTRHIESLERQVSTHNWVVWFNAAISLAYAVYHIAKQFGVMP